MCQIVGALASHVEQRTASTSQLICARFGAVGSTANKAALSFQAFSTFSHPPVQVLFPPETITIHVSGPFLALDRLGERTVSQLSLVKGVTFFDAALAAPAVAGAATAAGR